MLEHKNVDGHTLILFLFVCVKLQWYYPDIAVAHLLAALLPWSSYVDTTELHIAA